MSRKYNPSSVLGKSRPPTFGPSDYLVARYVVNRRIMPWARNLRGIIIRPSKCLWTEDALIQLRHGSEDGAPTASLVPLLKALVYLGEEK